MLQQLKFFITDYRRICGKYKTRFLYMWLTRIGVGIFVYRFERGMLLSIGKSWSIIRILLSPILTLLYAFSNLEISYHAKIGPGLLVLHAAPGIVISGKSIIGNNLTLTGGNIIGARKGTHTGNLLIGDNCYLGANAVVLGPVTLDNNLKVGACALVIHSYPDGSTLVGNPAKSINS